MPITPAHEDSTGAPSPSTVQDPVHNHEHEHDTNLKPKHKQKKRNRPHLALTKEETNFQQRFAVLFDGIAPRLTNNELRNLCTILRKRKNLVSVHGNVSAQLEALWKMEPPENVPPTWVQEKIRMAFVATQTRRKPKTESDSLVSREDSAPFTLRHEEDADKMVAILMDARDTAVRHCYWWSSGDDKLMRDKFAAAALNEGGFENWWKQRQTHHNERSPDVLRQEAEQLLNHLAERLPLEHMKRLMDSFQEMVVTTSHAQEKPRHVFPRVLKHVYSHVHLVASPISEFFYFRTPPCDEWELRIAKSLQNWNLQRDRFDAAMEELKYAVVLEGKKKTTSKAAQLELESVDVDLSFKGTPVRRKQKVPRFHVSLDTMLIGVSTKSIPNIDKMVLVDNLPVDITEMELFELYSRCGSIQSIELFNYRPDLDPGPLKPKQLKERIKKHRMNRNKQKYRRWTSPRTPVYGLITFASDDAYRQGIDDHLRIFGMVVRKHAVRSLLVSDISTLYVENIPKGIYAAALEYELAISLRDENVHIWLNRQPRRYAEVASCEIEFHSFESAYGCFDRVQSAMERLIDALAQEETDEPSELFDDSEIDLSHPDRNLSKLSINFIRTPDDAAQYWTRQKGFE